MPAACPDLSYSLLRRGLYAAVLDPCCAAYARALEAAERRAPAPRSPGGSPPGSPPRRDDEAGRQQRLLRQVRRPPRPLSRSPRPGTVILGPIPADFSC